MNEEEENLDFAAAWAAKLLHSDRRVKEGNLYLPEKVGDATDAQKPAFGWATSLFGLHLGKVALITGGSAGIGGQIGRLLALSGAKVCLAARQEKTLIEKRDAVIAELRQIGYTHPENRVMIVPHTDVANEAALIALVEKVIATYGRVDYLINNAGISGAEEMVIDMPVEAWRNTLQTNLISNYSLIRKLAPLMKEQGSGYVLNVSSYFGGEKYVAVPYPNRADYAVSKAGQRALAEMLARFLGPQIQINAIAPGPVDGTRLRGSAGQPGLYQRRGRLVLEGKRLNQIYAALIQSHKAKGQAIEDFLKLLDTNNPGELSAEAPAPLQKLAASLVAKGDAVSAGGATLLQKQVTEGDAVSAGGAALLQKQVTEGDTVSAGGAALLQEQVTEGDAVSAGGATLLQKQVSDTGSAYRFFMNPTIARKLVTRLELGSYLKDKVASQQWLEQLPVAPDPFFTPAEIEKEANKIKEGTLAMLNLNRMPTEQDVALATIYYLADRNVSGETFQPSGGLRFDRTVTEGELFGKPTPNRLEKLNSRTIFLIGEYMELPLERLAHSYLDEHQVGRIIILTHTQERANEYAKHFDSYAQQGRFHARPIGNELEAGLEAAIRDFDRPLACVSTPFIPLTQKRLTGKDENSWEGVFDEKDFAELCENQLTHHFRIARKMSLVDGVQIVLVTPETSRTTAPEGFGLANFVKTSLHALTVTLGVESERNVHQIPVNQVNLARRAHSEEPTDLSEEEEELTRFVNAVLLMTSTPLPDATISRYRSRIYRGNAITT